MRGRKNLLLIASEVKGLQLLLLRYPRLPEPGSSYTKELALQASKSGGTEPVCEAGEARKRETGEVKCLPNGKQQRITMTMP